MGNLEARKIRLRQALALLAHTGILVSTVAFVMVPLGMILQGGIVAPARPGGFAQGFTALAKLVESSMLVSLLPAVIATALAMTASACGVFVEWFRRFYVLWIAVMLFTNPVFLVLGFSTLLVRLHPVVAVVMATVYIILPLGGLIIQSAFEHFPTGQIHAARSLGASALTVTHSHLLPSVLPQALLACFLMTIYSLGFYLLPTFVGLGDVVTLGTSINTMASRLGDWQAAQQLACVTLGLQLFLVLSWCLLVSTTRKA